MEFRSIALAGKSTVPAESKLASYVSLSYFHHAAAMYCCTLYQHLPLSTLIERCISIVAPLPHRLPTNPIGVNTSSMKISPKARRLITDYERPRPSIVDRERSAGCICRMINCVASESACSITFCLCGVNGWLVIRWCPAASLAPTMTVTISTTDQPQT